VKVLVLGGTLFLGRHLVEAALERGDEVSIFNRGLTNPELFPEVEHLRGDRDAGRDRRTAAAHDDRHPFGVYKANIREGRIE